LSDTGNVAGSGTARPDGIYINDDNMTQGALEALHRLGLRVGQDI
jgi:DNA-binding LacI/PurR family transcriptional regulator